MPTHLRAVLRPIELDLAAAFSFERGFGRTELLKRAPTLEASRRELLAKTTGPQQLLDQYKLSRRSSPLGQILFTARRLRDAADRVVVIGAGPALAACEALFAACCHPFHNDLSRAERGGRPRIYFLPAEPDNDRLAGLIDILDGTGDWRILALDHDNDPKAIASVVEGSCDALLARVARPESQPAPRSGKGVEFGGALLPEPTWHPGVLMAASVMGMDIVALLRGGAMLHDRFRTSPVGDNPVLDLATLCHLLHLQRHTAAHVQTSSAVLRAIAHRYFDSDANGGLLVQIEAQEVRRDPLRVTMPGGTQSTSSKKRGSPTLPQVAIEELARVRRERAAASLSTAVIRLSDLGEFSIGQLIELLSLSRQIDLSSLN